ncbi:MAG: energy transducer TonB [Bryobacteraceae bacterium]|jgi:protein TonB
MFETAVLTNPSKRVWTTCAGVTAQALLVLAACLAPVVWPDILPRAQMLVSLVAPGAPERQEQPVAPSRQTARVVRPFEMKDGILRLPANAPLHPAILDDPPTDVSSIPSGGLLAGSGEGPGYLLRSILSVVPAVHVRPQEKPAPVVQPTPSQPIRLTGGDVRLARPIYRVEPIYPHSAIIARISGPVELEGIIGTDGRIRNLHALSGNPVLVPAALDAVRQWVYAPTLLNGKPVEVIAPITVIFRLDR